MKPRRRRAAGTFLAALALSLCVLGLPLAFLLIECNMRLTVYGRVEPTVTFAVEQGAPTLTDGQGHTLTLLPESERQAAYALLAAPARAALWLLRCQQEAVARLFSYFASG